MISLDLILMYTERENMHAAVIMTFKRVLGPILFVICFNDLTDNLTIDHLLYADDVKLIAPQKQAVAPRSSLVASSKMVRGLGVNPQPYQE